MAVGVIGEVDGFSVRRGAPDELVVERIDVGERRGRIGVRHPLGRSGVAVGVVGVAGEAVVGSEGLGLVRDDLRDSSGGGSGLAISDGIVRVR